MYEFPNKTLGFVIKQNTEYVLLMSTHTVYMKILLCL